MEPLEKIAKLKRMAEADQGDELIWFMLGLEHLHAGQPTEAARALRRCLELNPDHTAAYRLLGDACRLSGETAQAREAYERAIAEAERTGDLQVAKEARAYLKRLK